jgi:hypothetical protein
MRVEFKVVHSVLGEKVGATVSGCAPLTIWRSSWAIAMKSLLMIILMAMRGGVMTSPN